jgi:hypothetical protein
MKSKTNFALTLLFLNLPFILVWMAAIATGFAFNPKFDVFNTFTFWSLSTIYWFVFIGGILPAIWHDEEE